ncbi:hypothetical protein BDV39DRAFT_201058 [Aspergillus sergii]|uniref:Uncharacterized protein n=1 Tax=Aspergillus sergii TaxID=1034303 RepID=A0A5N6XDS6_9EURO|nr:hypothetical protein BDV39DRAFT_201058 [Aspergillus sergii]
MCCPCISPETDAHCSIFVPVSFVNRSRVLDGGLQVVHDWESAVTQPEVALAGLAAAVFSVTGDMGNGRVAILEATEAFLDAYSSSSGRTCTGNELEVAWAAGLWARLFNAKTEIVAVSGGPCYTRLVEVTERLRRSGAQMHLRSGCFALYRYAPCTQEYRLF